MTRLLEGITDALRSSDAGFWEGARACARAISIGFEAQTLTLSRHEQARVGRSVDLAAAAALSAAHGVSCDPKVVAAALAKVLERLAEAAGEREKS